MRLKKEDLFPGVPKPRPKKTILTWTAPSRPFKKRDRKYYTTVVLIVFFITYKLFDLYHHNQDDWKAFLQGAPYYKKILPVAFKELERHVTKYQPGLPLDINNIDAIDKSEYLDSVFRNLLKISFTIDYLFFFLK